MEERPAQIADHHSSVAQPGSAFIYGPSHLQIFSELLRRKLNGRATSRYIEAHVLNRLGLSRLNYKNDAHGNPLPATGFELTAREWAQIGRASCRERV